MLKSVQRVKDEIAVLEIVLPCTKPRTISQGDVHGAIRAQIEVLSRYDGKTLGDETTIWKFILSEYGSYNRSLVAMSAWEAYLWMTGAEAMLGSPVSPAASWRSLILGNPTIPYIQEDY